MVKKTKTREQYKYISKYYDAMVQRKILVPKKIRATYDHVVGKVLQSEDYEYREDLADHAINFIEKQCKHSKGSMGGKPFILEDWQAAMVAIIFGVVHKGTTLRKYRRAVLMIPRKNGKSTLAAAIGLYLLIADNEPGAEVYAVATKMDQAKIIWREAVSMLNKSSLLKLVAKSRVAEIVTHFTDGVFKPLGSDSKTLDGLNVHGALMDELEAWTDMDLYDVIVDGAAARENYLIFITTTAGNTKSEVFDRIYEDAEVEVKAYSKGKEKSKTSVYFIYELDDPKQWTQKKYWHMANPGLGTIKDLGQFTNKIGDAKRNKSLVRNLLAKDFNIPATHSSSWLDLHDIVNKADFHLQAERPDLPNGLAPRYAIGGFDLSETTDLTSASILFKMDEDSDEVYIKQMYWMPADLFEERIQEDKVPYRKWLDEGYITLCPGNIIDYTMVLDWFKKIQSEYGIYFYRIGYDSWHARYLDEEFARYFGDQVMEVVRQGTQTLSGPMKQLGAHLKANNINYGNNPMFEWCTSNVRVKPDNNNNIAPLKNNQPGVRIDGFVSALIAYTVYTNNKQAYDSYI